MMRVDKVVKKHALFISLIIFLSAVTVIFAFYAGELLVVDEKPQKSDVIIVLAGDHGARTGLGARLFQQGYAPYFMVSGGQVYHATTAADLMAAHAVELGIPEKSIILESRADSTYQNAVFTKELIHKYDFKSAIIISSNYHMRRVKLIFQREFFGSGVSLTYCAATDPEYNPHRWWATNKSLLITFDEYIKFIGYSLGKNT